MARTAGISLTVPPGVVRAATRALTPGRWTDANLVRWRGGNLQPIGGWERASPEPLPSPVRRMLAWEGNNIRRIGFLCEGHIIIETEGSFFDATPDDFVAVDFDPDVAGYGTNVYSFWDYGTERPDTANPFTINLSFSLDTWGDDLLVVSSSDGRLLYWDARDNPPEKCKVVENAPISIRYMVTTDERHVMIGAYGDNRRRVAWCSRENREDWDFASTTNTAGFLDLQTPGVIIGMTKVREGILVFTTADVWIVRFIGFPFIYGAERIATHAAPISPQAVVPFEGRAVWMAKEGFFLYEGGAVLPLQSEVADFVYKNLDRTWAPVRAHGSDNGLFPEICWWYPSEGQQEPDKYVCWDYIANWWSIGEMPRTVFHSAGLFPAPFGIGVDRFLYKHETGSQTDGVLPFAETGALSLGDDRLLSVLQAQPDTELGADKTRMTFFARNTLEGNETQHGPYVARPDGYMDVRFTARDVRLRVEATEPGDWTVGKVRLAVTQRGKR